jgi:hypothetical protein
MSTADTFVSWDFVRSFPHKFWISNWSSDETYPEGFRYKVLSTRWIENEFIELVLVLQKRDGSKQEMKRLEIRHDRFDDLAQRFCNSLEKQFGIEFKEQDLSFVSNEAEFDKAAQDLGWIIESGQSTRRAT